MVSILRKVKKENENISVKDGKYNKRNSLKLRLQTKSRGS